MGEISPKNPLILTDESLFIALHGAVFIAEYQSQYNNVKYTLEKKAYIRKKIYEAMKIKFISYCATSCAICANNLVGHVGRCPHCKAKMHKEDVTQILDNGQDTCPFCRKKFFDLSKDKSGIGRFYHLFNEQPFTHWVRCPSMIESIRKYRDDMKKAKEEGRRAVFIKPSAERIFNDPDRTLTHDYFAGEISALKEDKEIMPPEEIIRALGNDKRKIITR